ncbi:MAG: 50S ribosomal protein L21 [Thermodesulfovibrionales bacterium]
MYAIIESGGKQYKAAPGGVIRVERLDAAEGASVVLDKVLAVVKDDGSAVFGSPYVASAKVSAEVAGRGKASKVTVFKQKPRKGHRKTRGHRQPFTELRVKEIQGG